MREAPLVIVSLLGHRDILLYLVAFRSLYRAVGEGSATILSDGSLTEHDIAVLRGQIPLLTVRRIQEVDTGAFPKGGCWERLLLVLECARQSYVIQMDSDTLTVGGISEVVESYRGNRCFTLGTRMGQRVMTTVEILEALEGATSTHVQLTAERSLHKLRNADSLRYIRGSAGFTGFGKGMANPELLEEYNEQMKEFLGERWFQWGTEQVSSNFMIANSAEPRVLPYPRYATFRPGLNWEQSEFLHFNGTHRFRHGIYRKAAAGSIERARRDALAGRAEERSSFA
jgi:hypothetical protein